MTAAPRSESSCGCDPLVAHAPVVHNPPGRTALRWRTSPHGAVLRRMRAVLTAPDMPDPGSVLGTAPPDDPGGALLDAFAVVADTVSFYTERLADEGFIRTAAEPASVRAMARGIGYEMRPGVAATTDVVLTVEDAPGGPRIVRVAAGTPVQSVPGQDELPQVFQTEADLEARPQWNAIPVRDRILQEFPFGTDVIWLEATSLGLSPGDGLLIVGDERIDASLPGASVGDDERWDFRVVASVVEPADRPGWTRVGLATKVGYAADWQLTATDGARVYLLPTRGSMFGATAPDPSLISESGVDHGDDWPGMDNPLAEGESDVIEVDGDRPRMVEGSWVLLEIPTYRELYRVVEAEPSGATRFAVSGRLTRLRVDLTENLDLFDRRRTLVRGESRLLPGAHRPIEEPVGGSGLTLPLTDPPIPDGRRVVVTGYPPGEGPTDPRQAVALPPPLAEAADVVFSHIDPAAGTQTLVLAADLTHSYDPAQLQVHANVARVSHGETVSQVLGSGDGAVPFQRMTLRRGPLTYVSSDDPSGSRSSLEVRVDGVRWHEQASLDGAQPADRSYVVRLEEDGTAVVTFGDGVTGARLPTGAENVVATYRTGIGSPGSLDAHQLSLLPRRPQGISRAINPVPTADWADPETMNSARTVAPLRTRTLDRAVTVADHEDAAAGFAGVTLARADSVWDGRTDVVAVSVLGADGVPAGQTLLGSLRSALRGMRDPGTPLAVLQGEVVRFGVRVEVEHDPDYLRGDVEAAVVHALTVAYSAPATPFAVPVTSSAVLVTIRDVPGVRACTMPRLVGVLSSAGDPPVLADPADPDPFVAALPARFDGATLRPAQATGLADGAVVIGEMP